MTIGVPLHGQHIVIHIVKKCRILVVRKIKLTATSRGHLMMNVATYVLYDEVPSILNIRTLGKHMKLYVMSPQPVKVLLLKKN